MAWCDACNRYLTPSSMGADGSCPVCGVVVEAPVASPKAPWHFWVLVGALSLYLGWRAVQGVAWLVGRML